MTVIRLVRSAGFVLSLLLLHGCATLGNSQFVDAGPELHNQPLSVDNPQNKILLIYNHGSRPEGYADPCFPNNAFLPGGMPSVVHHLAGETIDGKTLVVYALCSQVGGLIKLRDTEENLKIRHRIAEIERAVDRFHRLGFAARQIFLVGHSAGGWASLMVAAEQPESVNAVIAFSPAFAGFRKTRNRQWWAFRRRLAEQLSASPYLDALVFAFPGDPYNTLEELAFLGRIPGVEYRPLTGSGELAHCYRGHRTAFRSCFERNERSVILDFIRQRL